MGRRWRDIWRSLSEAGGIWEVPRASEELHWKLDKFEDPSRRSASCFIEQGISSLKRFDCTASVAPRLTYLWSFSMPSQEML